MTDVGAPVLVPALTITPWYSHPAVQLSAFLNRWLHCVLLKSKDGAVQPHGFSPLTAFDTQEAPSTCLWDEWVNLGNLHWLCHLKKARFTNMYYSIWHWSHVACTSEGCPTHSIQRALNHVVSHILSLFRFVWHLQITCTQGIPMDSWITSSDIS